MKTKQMYVYLVEERARKTKYLMIGNLKNPNLGSGRYLYQFAGNYDYSVETPYGARKNISTGTKYNSSHYRIVHQMAV